MRRRPRERNRPRTRMSMTQVCVRSTPDLFTCLPPVRELCASDGNFPAHLFRRSRKRKPMHTQVTSCQARGSMLTLVRTKMPPPTRQYQDGQEPVLIRMIHFVSSWQGCHRPMGSSELEAGTYRGKRHPKPKPAIPDYLRLWALNHISRGLRLPDSPQSAPAARSVFSADLRPRNADHPCASQTAKRERSRKARVLSKRDMAAFCVFGDSEHWPSSWIGFLT